MRNIRYGIVTKWGYPFGGGEQFMYGTMLWAKQANMDPYWISFYQPSNEHYPTFSAVDVVFDGLHCGKLIHVPGGYTDESLKTWLQLLQIDFVHHQGHLRVEMLNVCVSLNIPFIAGFHFWHGAIVLDESKQNDRMLENAGAHQVDENFAHVLEKSAQVYVASPFMVDVIEKVTDVRLENVILASAGCESSQLHPLSPAPGERVNDFIGRRMQKMGRFDDQQAVVSAMSIHKLKGGELFFHLFKNMPDIPFLGVEVELFSDGLGKKIKMAAEFQSGAGVEIIPRVSDIREVHCRTRVMLIPSLVDETFCRVALEAMINGIPIVTTGAGNIKYLVGDAGIVIPDRLFSAGEKSTGNQGPAGDQVVCPVPLQPWMEAVRKLYTDDAEWLKYHRRALQRAQECGEMQSSLSFLRVCVNSTRESARYNVAFFSPWCDQGLGIQCKRYVDILHNDPSFGKLFRTHVFAFRPYFVEDRPMDERHQRDPSEWDHPRIYYSPNVREKVTDDEIVEFITRYNIGKVIIPETCWFRVFEMAKLLKSHNVKVYAVPNIEIVRRDEIGKHRHFHRILCNSYFCESVFQANGYTNTSYVGYSQGSDALDTIPPLRARSGDGSDVGTVRFLNVGGMNAITRKQCLKVCQAFALAMKSISSGDAHLICTIQGDYPPEIDAYRSHPDMTIITEHLPFSQLKKMYHECHVNVQVSKHEGLGIGFFESISIGKPVITLDAMPHGEIIVPDVNGWTVPCNMQPMQDNTDSFLESAHFEPADLAETFVRIIREKSKLSALSQSTLADYHARYGREKFARAFVGALTE
uniref:Glycosyl transferase family 1 domain-containing protein n=1 Tax=viral metagenome TaxID=1070528 RepID=A0A6C0BPY8_9ZZZZ